MAQVLRIKRGTLGASLLPTVPIEKGGTGVTTHEEARLMLGVNVVPCLNAYAFGDSEIIVNRQLPSGRTIDDIFSITIDVSFRGDNGTCQGFISQRSGALTGVTKNGLLVNIGIRLEEHVNEIVAIPGDFFTINIKTGTYSSWSNLSQIQEEGDFEVTRLFACFK